MLPFCVRRARGRLFVRSPSLGPSLGSSTTKRRSEVEKKEGQTGIAEEKKKSPKRPTKVEEVQRKSHPQNAGHGTGGREGEVPDRTDRRASRRKRHNNEPDEEGGGRLKTELCEIAEETRSPAAARTECRRRRIRGRIIAFG